MYGSSKKPDESKSYANIGCSPNPPHNEGLSFSQKAFVLKSVLTVSILIAGFYAIHIRVNETTIMTGMVSSKDMVTTTAPAMLSSKEMSPMRLRMYNLEYSKEIDLTARSHPFITVGLLAEPQRDTTIELSIDDAFHGNCSYDIKTITGGGPWDDIPGVVPALRFTATGNFSNSTETGVRLGMVKFPSPGIYRCVSTCLRFDGYSETTTTSDISVFYIRRELRKLTENDRSSFVHCFVTMLNVNQSDGIKKYGIHYKPIEKFEVMHLEAAGDRRTDHFHDGMGLTTQHAAMSSEFELSMQSVHPHVALPYWDYTKDSRELADYSVADGRGDEAATIFSVSKLFTEKWFGNTDCESHIVTKGPLAYQEVPRNYGNYSTRSPYGFLRAPWNINPNKYVTRYHKICGSKVDDAYNTILSSLQWPTCAIHFKYTNTDLFSSWYDWSMNIGYDPHGPVHSWIGGVGGLCDSAWDELERMGWITRDHLRKLKFYSFVMLKNMWRHHVIEAPKYCSPDTNVSQCIWKCASGHVTNIQTSTFFESFIGLNRSNPHYEDIVNRVLCETPFWPGDQLEAASPVDISFWPIHPTIERLLQYKELSRPFKNKTWTTDKSLTCKYSGKYGKRSECEGHNPEDLTHFKSTTFDTTRQQYTTELLTNRELRDRASLTHGYAQTYVYDNFQWDHCDGIYRFKEVEKSDVVVSRSALG